MKPIPIQKQYQLTDEETAFLEKVRLFTDEELHEYREGIRRINDLKIAREIFNDLLRYTCTLFDTIIEIENKTDELEAKEKEPEQIKMKGI